MKDIKNFLIKREQSQACLSFAKREKSRLLAKLMITLVALLAVTTGAWADGIACTASDLGKVLCTDGSIYENVSAATTAGKTAAAVIAYVDETNKNGLALALTDEASTMNWTNATGASGAAAHSPAAPTTTSSWMLPSKDQWEKMFAAFGGNSGSYTGLNTAIGNAGGTAFVVGNNGSHYWTSTKYNNSKAYTAYLDLASGQVGLGEQGMNYDYYVRACLAFDIAASTAPTGPEVAWNKTSKTGTFAMPGGNVELEPEYYPQAALTAQPTAINDVPATTDGAIVKAGTVANIGSTTTAQGTLMYYVSPTPMTDAQLLALAADQWTADVPTAEKLAKGEAYVYYYVRGNDSDTDDETFSDGDILAANALTVTIAAAPTYAVTFADDLAEPTKWTASPNTGVTKGQPVTVTYTGTKKVLGMKAEKKAATAEGHALADAVVGDIVGSDGKAYAVADKDKLPEGVTAVAVMAKGGTAIALTDESGTMVWDTAKSTCSAKTAVPGGTWGLVHVDKWNSILSYNGGNMDSYTGLNETITAAGGTALQEGNYWSLTEYYADNTQAYTIKLNAGSKSNETKAKTEPCRVRAVLTF